MAGRACFLLILDAEEKARFEKGVRGELENRVNIARDVEEE